LGPAAAPKRAGGRRYALGLAIRSALRGLRPLGLAFGHPAAALGPKKGAAMLAAPEFRAKNIDLLTL